MNQQTCPRCGDFAAELMGGDPLISEPAVCAACVGRAESAPLGLWPRLAIGLGLGASINGAWAWLARGQFEAALSATATGAFFGLLAGYMAFLFFGGRPRS